MPKTSNATGQFPEWKCGGERAGKFYAPPFFAFGAVAKNLLKKYYEFMGYFIAYTDLKCAIKFIAARFEISAV